MRICILGATGLVGREGASNRRNGLVVLDRDYFTSIYFRAPDGLLMEIATDGPGFAVDEEPAALGTSLRLPAWLEERRDEIAASLPSLP